MNRKIIVQVSDTTMYNKYATAGIQKNVKHNTSARPLNSFKSSFIKLVLVMFLAGGLASCETIDIYEKTVAFPNHNWKSAERPSFTFEITDTTTLYNIFLVLRHEDAYSYNNIWVNLTVKGPADTITIRREFILGNNRKGWLGSGMDDIFEHRIPFNNKPTPLRKGKYVFTLQQDMREDPLDYVMNAGVRVEKAKRDE